MHRDMASTLNSWGYNAVVVDHYTLRGIAAPHTGVAVHGARGEDRALDFIETGRWVQQQSWHQGKSQSLVLAKAAVACWRWSMIEFCAT